MKAFYDPQFKLGILGGGQLGRMLIQSGIDLNLQFSILDPDPNAPCKDLVSDFHCGDLKDYDTVVAFGEKCDLITIEIEHINIDALYALERMGKTVYPKPALLEIVQDKGLQKQFYAQNNIPTAPFELIKNLEEARTKITQFPIVHKLRKDGYDGKGVHIIRTAEDIETAFDAPSLLEQMIPFEKEIAVIVARNPSGDVTTFPAVEMVFHPTANLVEYLFSPAQISDDIARKADNIATDIAQKLDLIGILAVEMFCTSEGDVLVNEIASRPHNSGHQTIEGNMTSQYAQHLRAILNLPLGDTAIIKPSAMVNVLGHPDYTGDAKPKGLAEIMKVEGVYPHFYGKKITKPFRKMGHVTILDNDIAKLKEKATFVKETLNIVS